MLCFHRLTPACDAAIVGRGPCRAVGPRYPRRRDHQRPRLVAHLCTVDNATDPWRRASTVSSPTSTSHDEPAGRKGLRTTLPPHNVQSRVALGASRDAPWAGVTQRSGVKFRNLAPSLDVGRSLCDRSCVPSSKGNGHGRPDEGHSHRLPGDCRRQGPQDRRTGPGLQRRDGGRVNGPRLQPRGQPRLRRRDDEWCRHRRHQGTVDHAPRLHSHVLHSDRLPAAQPSRTRLRHHLHLGLARFRPSRRLDRWLGNHRG